MEFLAQQGEGTFIVKDGKQYYQVNLGRNRVWKDTIPDNFLRHGYWEDSRPSDEIKSLVENLIKNS